MSTITTLKNQMLARGTWLYYKGVFNFTPRCRRFGLYNYNHITATLLDGYEDTLDMDGQAESDRKQCTNGCKKAAESRSVCKVGTLQNDMDEVQDTDDDK